MRTVFVSSLLILVTSSCSGDEASTSAGRGGSSSGGSVNGGSSGSNTGGSAASSSSGAASSGGSSSGGASSGGATSSGGSTGLGGGSSGGATSSGGAASLGGASSGGSATGGTGGVLVAACGDRRITSPEECDDGNTNPGDGCDGACKIESSATCGNGIVDRGTTEQCDDNNQADGDGCSSRCLIEAPSGCGDGSLALASGEECDDGGTLPGDGCSPSCQLEAVGAFCGDGSVDPGEVCDFGDTLNGDGCSPTCNSTGTTEIFVGSQGQYGAVDGQGTAARIGNQMPNGNDAAFGALAADSQYLWFADGVNGTLRRITVATADVLTVANISGAEGAATNGVDTVYVAGGNPPVIEAVSTTPPYTVTTVTGGNPQCTTAPCADGPPGTATFGGIRGLTWFGGYLWIVDPPAATIRRLDPATGAVTTVAGSAFQTGYADGVGSVARFQSPRYITSDNSGVLYVSDTQGATIRALNATTFAVSTFAGNGTQAYLDDVGSLARIHRPRGITADGSSIYFAEFNAHTIRQGVLETQSVTTFAGLAMTPGYVEDTGDIARFDSPFAVAYHFPSRSLFVLDSGNAVIRRIK